MPFVSVANLNTHYQRIGKGPTLVLLHGWANTWEAWAPLIAPLAEHFTLIIPDLPGFGKSETPKDACWSTPQYANWLYTFLETLHLKPLALIGHSYGAKIASCFAFSLMKPAPKRLVLIGSSGIPTTLTKSKKIVAAITNMTPRFLKNALPDAVVRAFYKNIVGETDYADANRFQKATLRNILAEDFTDQLANIRIPTLILWGEHDQASPTEKAEIFHRQIRNSTLVIVPDTGHFPHHENPTAVLNALKGFLP